MTSIIADLVITISKDKYEDLIRDSECLEILRNLYRQNSYFNEATVKTILGIEPAKERCKESEEK